MFSFAIPPYLFLILAALSYGSHLESTIEHHKQAKDDRPENQNWVVYHISKTLNNLSNSLF